MTQSSQYGAAGDEFPRENRTVNNDAEMDNVEFCRRPDAELSEASAFESTQESSNSTSPESGAKSKLITEEEGGPAGGASLSPKKSFLDKEFAKLKFNVASKLQGTLELIETTKDIFELAWSSSPREVLERSAATLAISASKLGSVFMGGVVISDLARTKGVDFSHLWLHAGILLGVQLGSKWLEQHEKFLADSIDERIYPKTNSRTAEKLAGLTAEELEMRSLSERLSGARQNQGHLSAFMGATFGLVGSTTAALGFGANLSQLGWWAVGLCVTASLPRLFVEFRHAEKVHKLEAERAKIRNQYWEVAYYTSTPLSVKELQTLEITKPIRERMDALSEQMKEMNLELSRKASKLRMGVDAITHLFESTLYVSLAYMAAHHLYDPTRLTNLNDIGKFSFYAGSLIAFSQAIQSTWSGLGTQARACGLVRYLTGFTSRRNREDADSFEADLDAVLLKELGPRTAAPRITFDDVSYSYLSETDNYEKVRGAPALSKINFTIEPGEFVAIVGENGSGKSTLVDLLLAHRNPTAGKILLNKKRLEELLEEETSGNGKPLKDLPASAWRKLEGVMPQKYLNFNSYSIGESIELGRHYKGEGLTIDEALEKSGAGEFVKKLPAGVNTKIAPQHLGGQGLSGGELQRLALGRAFISKSSILILDEPTSNIDPQHEAKIAEYLRIEARGTPEAPVTRILVTHRFGLLEGADKIIVLKKGENGGTIDAIGTHSEVYAKSEIYRNNYDAQSKPFRAMDRSLSLSPTGSEPLTTQT